MKQHSLAALLVLAVVASASSSLVMPQRRTEIARPRADSIDYRLPTNVVPSDYLVVLEPNFSEFTFEGYVEIAVTVTEETDNITLHAAEITFLVTSVLDANEESLTIFNETDDTTRQFRIIQFDKTLDPGEYQIRINYTGILNNQMRGFYRSSYTNSAGETVWLGTTQFESTDARRAFPSFDEPALKATFTIHIIRPESYNSISNMPLVETVDLSDNRQLDIFEKSVRMSTYLVAFIVSDFTYIEAENQRVYSRPDYIEYGNGDFALSVGIPCLKALEEYTGVNYSLSKMYQASIPDFSAGAMENWGLVTYRETALLFNKTTTTTSSKQSIEVVIAHEYTHQWFGDLVGPEWWSYLWLNEGFASYLQYHVGAVVKPTWRLREQLVVVNIYGAFNYDATETTRPMTFDAGSPSEISALFDTIAYGKSGAVLRMLSNAISEDAFRAGLKRYLEARQYQEANSGHLWDNIQAAVEEEYPDALPDGLTVPLVMTSWETQSGYPVVNATRDYDTSSVLLTQERFLLNKNIHEYNTTWYVPINYATRAYPDYSDTRATHWLLPDSDLNISLGITATQWLLVNKQVAGYYRVNYDETNWKLLASYLNTADYVNISPLNRAHLIYDAFTLARSGRLSYSVALELTNYLHRETDYIPLYAFFSVFSYFNTLASGGSNYKLFEARLAHVLDAAVNELGAQEKEGADDDDEHVNNLNRINVITYACRYGNAKCRELATARLSDIDSITVDLQTAVLCGGLRGANQSVWDAVYARSLTETSSTLRSRLTSALGCSEVESVLDNYVQNALDNGESVFSNIYGQGNFGYRYVFNYLLNNLEKVHTALGNSSTGSAIRGVASYLTTQDQLDQLIELNATANSALSSYIASAISTVESNIESYSLHFDDITSWITERLSDYDNGDNDDDDGNDDDDNGNNDDDDDDDGGNDGGDNGGNAASAVTLSLTTLVFILSTVLLR